jgi:hypothetical protein
MASMQIVGGTGASGPGKSGSSGGVDPLLMGLSAEATASADTSGDESLQENPFATELAAALATLDAQQVQALAENLLDGALQDGQILDPEALKQVTGQNLPVDPAFQNAILASFAALSGLVNGQSEHETVAPGGGGQTAAGTGLSGAAADATILNGNPEADFAVGSVTLPAGLGQAQGTTSVDLAGAVASLAQSKPDEAIEGRDAAALSQSGVQIKSNANALGAEQSIRSTSNSAQSDFSASTAAIDSTVNRTAAGGSGQSPSQGGSSAADSSVAAAMAEAARAKSEKETAEYAGKQTTLAGSLAGDIGNIVVTAKPNTEGVAVAADAARQLVQKLEGSGAAAAGQSSLSQSAEASARAESKLEAARASLGTGPLNVEILKLTRQGGGRAVLEVTPPNQGPIRIDLQLDGAGRASLVVEGLSDSMKARLESSAHFLRQDMAQMGLALNLEMRERNDSGGAAQAFAQSQSGQSGQGGSRDQGSIHANALATSSVAGNNSVAQRSAAVDDGIHLVA